MLAVGFGSGAIRVFQPDDADVIADIRQKSGAVRALTFDRDGTSLVTLSEDGHLVLYSTLNVSPG